MIRFLEFISEARSHKEKNVKKEIVELLEPYSKSNDYYITFIDIPKVGINPKNSFGTPIGIYSYPIKEVWEDFVDNMLPFASERKYVGVFKHKNGKMLNRKATQKDLNMAIEILKEKYEEVFEGRSIEEFYTLKTRDGDIFKAKTNSYFHKIWFLAANVAKSLKGESKGSNGYTVVWNKILREDLGYIGAEDRNWDANEFPHGEGIIHPNEECQAVFFSRDVLTDIDILNNSRKNLDIDDEYIESSKSISSNKKKYIEQLSSSKLGKLSGKPSFKPMNFYSPNIQISEETILIENVKISNLSFSSKKASSVTFKNCSFEKDNFIEGCTLINCGVDSNNEFKNCDIDMKRKSLDLNGDSIKLIDCSVKNLNFIYSNDCSDLSVLKGSSIQSSDGKEPNIVVRLKDFNLSEKQFNAFFHIWENEIVKNFDLYIGEDEYNLKSILNNSIKGQIISYDEIYPIMRNIIKNKVKFDSQSEMVNYFVSHKEKD